MMKPVIKDYPRHRGGLGFIECSENCESCRLKFKCFTTKELFTVTKKDIEGDNVGCDIHAFLEYSNGDFIEDFGSIRIARNYGLFTVLAGVRAGNATVKCFKPKGFPEDAGFLAIENYSIYISSGSCNFDGCCTQEEAEKYLRFSSEYIDDNKRRISNPDWHSASWLNTEELRLAYQRYMDYFTEPVMLNRKLLRTLTYERIREEVDKLKTKTKPVAPIPEIVACIATMEALESLGRRARLVFWFDN